MNKKVNVLVWFKQGCSYCEEVKQYLEENHFDYQAIDVTENDHLRDILDVKYVIRHVPVVEVGFGNRYDAVTEVGIDALEDTLKHYRLSV
ncbi:glutaredoxin family protein [Salinicoccus roseus]|uniref:glutaredoxin family protein n=1 Tax=Salinicoccus roseus TaxID=45670 RepID=UPI0035265E04